MKTVVIGFRAAPSAALDSRTFSCWMLTGGGTRDLMTSQVLAGTVNEVTLELDDDRQYQCELIDACGGVSMRRTVMRFSLGDTSLYESGSMWISAVEDLSSSSSSPTSVSSSTSKSTSSGTSGSSANSTTSQTTTTTQSSVNSSSSNTSSATTTSASSSSTSQSETSESSLSSSTDR